MEHKEMNPAVSASATPWQPDMSQMIPGQQDWPSLPVCRTKHADADTTLRVACLERLATALSGFSGLNVIVRADGSAPYLAVHNNDAPVMSETITVDRSGDGFAFMWSWRKRIGDVRDPDSAAYAIAYVLAVTGEGLSGR